MFQLPADSPKKYPAAARCIYCASVEALGEEHIIPFGLGGKSTLPRGSCKKCAKITGAFEGTCLRTILGPLRMYFDLPSRRKNERPKKLPLKVKLTASADWSYIDVDQESYPFLILMPLLPLPDELSGHTTLGERGAKVKQLWIRGASFRHGITPHVQELAEKLGVAVIEPTATFKAAEFFRMLAKIAHSFALAEMGSDALVPFLRPIICDGETGNSVQYIGGLETTEAAVNILHELSFCSLPAAARDVIAVRIRLLAALETPTYFVAVGRLTSGGTP